MNDRLQTALRQLRLRAWPNLGGAVAQAATHQLSHAEFLELILQDELLVRNQRLIDRRVKVAPFRELKALDDFNWVFNPSIPRKQIFDLATCRFVREAQDVLFWGRPAWESRSWFKRSVIWRSSRASSCSTVHLRWSATSCMMKHSTAKRGAGQVSQTRPADRG